MQALKSIILACAGILGPVGVAVTGLVLVLVPLTVALCLWWLGGSLGVWDWVGIVGCALLFGPVLVVVILVVQALQATVFAPDWVDRHPSGTARAQGPHHDGDRQGHWTFWHEDGWKEREGDYVAGFESGIWTFYHPNGRRCARGELHGWRRRGAWEFWDDAARPLAEAEFLACYPGAAGEGLPPRDGDSAAGTASQAEPGPAAE